MIPRNKSDPTTFSIKYAKCALYLIIRAILRERHRAGINNLINQDERVSGLIQRREI